jgi:hypothetical protein
MSIAVKNYLLENNLAYSQAIKKTGPIDNTSLYIGVNRKRESGKDQAMFCLDDPYW